MNQQNDHNRDLPKENSPSPTGVLLLRTVAMPADTNPNGDIFGGWIMSQMDTGGAIMANELAQGRVVTVAADAMAFHAPVKVGDVVACYGSCVKIGRTSLRVRVEVWTKKVERDPYGQETHVTEGVFTYVAVDADGRPRPLPPDVATNIPDTYRCEE